MKMRTLVWYSQVHRILAAGLRSLGISGELQCSLDSGPANSGAYDPASRIVDIKEVSGKQERGEGMGVPLGSSATYPGCLSCQRALCLVPGLFVTEQREEWL